MTIGGIVLTEKNRLHHAMKEQDFIDNTKKTPSFIDKESVANAIKDYQKQKSIHSLSIKESPKVINHDINRYQDENNADEDTIKKALYILMTEGLRINYGETLGKTIINAQSFRHQNIQCFF